MTRTEERRDVTGFWWGNQKEIFTLEDLSIDWKIILKLFFKRWNEEI
jgi:hypothetical protein